MTQINALCEAIILAGGKGTRLKSVSGDLPKPMMPVCGKPFLEGLLTMLLDSGIRRTILALGYQPEVFRAHFGSDFRGMSLVYSIEDSPLGTGGALRQALMHAENDNLLVLNGDSHFHIDLKGFFAYHTGSFSEITIALKYFDDCSRYGTVSFSNDRIDSFREKGCTGSGFINGGLYVVNRSILSNMPGEGCFSFETDFLEKRVKEHKISPYISNGYFIDIGTPADYMRAQIEFLALTGADQ